ncbi:hypothetical protein Q5692_07135 [Microcoleus sp. C2C3]|uniref:TRADD-N-associated membrane domain-containing protein n=1 Tax=unclassified Microcoleus TaxID=2642155 RepID=UPI002FD270DC
MNKKLSTNAHSALEMIIAEERLRQSRYSFNAALAATIFSSIVSAALLLSGKVPEGAVTTSISVGCSKLAKDANDRLDRITKELIDDSRETADIRSKNEPRRREEREERQRKCERT